jgi:hypothetical protein
LLKHLKQEFGGLVESLKAFPAPAPPRTMVKRPDKEDTIIPVNHQTYRSGVGMLLYLEKHTRFDIANSFRELSKVADGATMAHWKLLPRCIKYIITTENLVLKVKPNKLEGMTELEGISDSEYAADQETQISVFGWNFISSEHYHGNQRQAIVWTEAEYSALSEIDKEIMFVK